MAKAESKKAQHSQAEPDYGTPGYFADSARVVFGGAIDLDPASSPLFNEIVQARKIYTRQDDGLLFEWLGNLLVNPPGEDSGRAVKLFWEKLVSEYVSGNVKSALWIGFNIEQLQQLQRTRVDANPFHFPTCIPYRRIPFNKSLKDHQVSLFDENRRELVPSSRPAHANFITFLPDLRKPYHVEIFRKEFSQYGAIR